MKRSDQGDRQLIIIQLDLKLLICIIKKIVISRLGEEEMEKKSLLLKVYLEVISEPPLSFVLGIYFDKAFR